MGEVERCSPTRVLFTQDELASLDKDQLLQHWSKQENYINWMESQLSSAQIALTPVRELEEKLRNSISSESARRESVLLMRLNSKEQEIQDLIVQIQELKASQAGSPASLRSSLLDPAVNALIQHLRKELEKAKSALEETQNELSAWKFTPDSNTGKRLMAKCRLLYQENEELGRMISSGRLAKLEGDLALQRNFSEEMKKSQSELDEFLLELDEDVEGMQSTIYFLQQQLRQTRDQLVAVQKENEILRNCGSNSVNASLPETQFIMGSPRSGNQHDPNNQMYQSSSSQLIGLISDRCNGPTQHSSKRNFDKILDISGHRLPLPEPGIGSNCGLVADHSIKYLNSENVKKRIVKQEHNMGSNEEIQASLNALLISRTNEKECGQIRSKFSLEASQSDSLSYENSCGIDVENVANDAIEPSSDLLNSNHNRTNNTVVTTDLSQQSDAVEARVDIDCCHDRNKKSDGLVEPEIKKESKKSFNSQSPNGSVESADQEFNVGSSIYQDEEVAIDVSQQEGGNMFGVGSSANVTTLNHTFSDGITEDGDKNLSIADQDPSKNYNSRKRVSMKPEGDASSPRSSFIFKSSNQAVSESKDSSETYLCSKTLETVSMYKRPRVDPPKDATTNRDKEEIEHINP